MDINEMSRKQFEELRYLKGFDTIAIDSLVLLPTKRHNSSGYNNYEVIACHHHEAIGRLYGYDTFSIIMESDWNRVGIDCLRGSCLMRIFLPDEYEIWPMFHEARKRRDTTSEKNTKQ